MKENEQISAAKEVLQLPISKIARNPNQPRKVFSEESIIKLADSVRQYGFIQPLVVRTTLDGYELISGERRLRAAEELSMTHVPCTISDVSEVKSAEIAIIENLIREDLNVFEEAEAIASLIDIYGFTQEEIAAKLENIVLKTLLSTFQRLIYTFKHLKS